jgi:hypothetical protein
MSMPKPVLDQPADQPGQPVHTQQLIVQPLENFHLQVLIALGDFCQRTYHLACLFARLLCCDNSYIVRLCACCRALKPTENPAQSGTFFSGNRLAAGDSVQRKKPLAYMRLPLRAVRRLSLLPLQPGWDTGILAGSES